MTITERMAAGLERLERKWGSRRRPKAFYLGPVDWAEFMATNPPTAETVYNREAAIEPVFKGFPVRASKNVTGRRSKLYDHTSTSYELPESDPPPSRQQVCPDVDYPAVEAKLTEISRTRALTDEESWLLERAIRRYTISLRECAALGIRRLSHTGSTPRSVSGNVGLTRVEGSTQ